MAGAFFYCTESSKQFEMRWDASEWVPMEAGLGFRLQSPDSFPRLTLFPGRLEDAFNFFCEWAWETSLAIPGEKALVVDEAWAYQTSHGIPTELKTIVQSGRKRGLHVMVNIQEPNRLNGAILNGASEFVCFRLQSPRRLTWCGGQQDRPDRFALRSTLSRCLPALHRLHGHHGRRPRRRHH